MLTFENRIRELAEAITQVKKVVDEVNDRANGKIDEMKKFVHGVGGRFDQIEQTLPERLHKVESRHEGIIGTLNEVTKDIHNRFQELENLMKHSNNPPNFGGPTAQSFNIGSPLNGPISNSQTTSPPPPPDPWAAFERSRTSVASNGQAPPNAPFVAAPTPNPHPGPQSAHGPHKPWDARMWSTTEAKVSKELRPFNGTHTTYKTWANRVKDHFIKKNADWHYLFREVEAQKAPIARDLLKVSWLNGNGYTMEVDVGWCASALWTFIGEHVIDTVYNNRNVLAGGHNNGLELWRALFVRHEGGADFPQCDKIDSLQFWVGKWTEMKDAYGVGISDMHLRSMFINILPPSVQKEVREKPGLITLQQCIDHVLCDLGRLNDAQLSKLHMDRLKQSLNPSQRISW